MMKRRERRRRWGRIRRGRKLIRSEKMAEIQTKKEEKEQNGEEERWWRFKYLKIENCQEMLD